MDTAIAQTCIPVIVLYNLNPSWSEQDKLECLVSTHLLATSLASIGHPVEELGLQSTELATLLKNFKPDNYVVFNWCEELPGINHSEYQVAQILEELGYIFTGSDSHSLGISQDKHWVKRILERLSIPIPEWKVYSTTRRLNWSRFPAIVKLANEHSSYGITRESVVLTLEELRERVHYVINELHQPALVEEFIDGREFHIGIIGNENITVLPPAEIDYSAFPDIHDRLCTYESNFDKTSRAYQLTKPKVPAKIIPDQLVRLQNIAVDAYRALNCRDYARMDIRLRDGAYYLLDVNPNPDISSDTSLALGAELVGLSYGKLISQLVNLAAKRHPVFKSSFRSSRKGADRCLEL